MPLEYYRTALGEFPVIADDGLYNAINSLGAGLIWDKSSGLTTLGQALLANVPQLTSVRGVVYFPAAATEAKEQITDIFQNFLPSVAFVPKEGSNTSDVTEIQPITGYNTKRAQITYRFINTVNFALDSAIRFPEGGTYTSINKALPYGKFRHTGAGNTPLNLIYFGVLYCNHDKTQFGYLEISAGTNGYNEARLSHAVANQTQTTALTIFFDGIEPEPEPSDDPYEHIDGESDIPGGGSVAIPGLPPATATATGIIGLFVPTEAQMQQLADFMWTDFGGQGTTVVEVLEELVDAIKRSISNPLDYVIGLNIIPSQGLTTGALHTVKFGFVSSGVSMPRLASQYFEVDCGSLSFDALCGDTFLDYAPYSKFSIYLPYIGFKDVDANDFVGHTIGVKYHGDTVTGGVTAYVTKDGSVMYQYSGCCALNIPLSSDNWGSTIAATVQIATSMVAGGIAGGAAGVGKAAVNGAANVAANPSLLSPQVQHSGAVSGGAGAMGVQFPFVVREAVRFHSTTSFNKISGYPSFYYRQLSTVTGFTTILDVHLDGISATRGEIMEIENLLKSGVIL